MLIKLKNTTLGMAVCGIIKPKTPKDPPFEVPDELGLSLIREGKAVCVFPDVPDASAAPVADIAPAAQDAPVAQDIPEYNEFTTKPVLQAIANEHGIEISSSATKTEILKALDNFFADESEE